MTADADGFGQVEENPNPDRRKPWIRLGQLMDPGSIRPLHTVDSSGVLAARGRIEGSSVIAYCTDATRSGGAMGAEGCRHLANAIDAAVGSRCPVIGIWHCGGARLADGAASLDAVGKVFAAMVRACGRVPQLSVVVGPAAAYGPALTDLVIMSRGARVFVTGPDVVRSVTSEEIDQEGLGGFEAHGRKSGVVHVVADSEPEAYLRARRLANLFARQGFVDPSAMTTTEDLRLLLPERANRAYDVRPLVRRILDGGGESEAFEELQARWAPNVVVGLGRLGGRSVGVIASNPLGKGGCLDSFSAEKAARFVRMCDSFGVPLLVIVDLPGLGQEWGGVVRSEAKLSHAFAEASVPRVTLVTRKAYGGAYIAMKSRSLGATAAVGVLHRRALAEAFAAAGELRGRHRNILL
jgi:acetyl-CoA/propionyl-CoA carboxylase carboxyl transferase subunit